MLFCYCHVYKISPYVGKTNPVIFGALVFTLRPLFHIEIFAGRQAGMNLILILSSQKSAGSPTLSLSVMHYLVPAEMPIRIYSSLSLTNSSIPVWITQEIDEYGFIVLLILDLCHGSLFHVHL